MDRRRTPYAIAVAAVSLGLLAACSDEADRTPDAPAEQVTPVPAAPPADTSPATPPADTMPSPPPASSMTPDSGNTMPPPVEETSPPAGGGAAPVDPVPDTPPS